MESFAVRVFCFVLSLVAVGTAQEVIPLYAGTAPASTQENYPEKQYFSKVWNTDVVTNVTRPTLTVFKPSPELKNGTAVVICPGWQALWPCPSRLKVLNVAQYLAAKGVTAFVLKYRLMHYRRRCHPGILRHCSRIEPKYLEAMKKIKPLAVADGLAAVTWVRQHAAEWGISPDRVGIIGFSAGGYGYGRSCGPPRTRRSARVCSSNLLVRIIERRSRPIGCTAHVHCGRESTISGSRQRALRSMRSGLPPKKRPNCTFMRRVIMLSECEGKTFLRITGSTGLPDWLQLEGFLNKWQQPS